MNDNSSGFKCHCGGELKQITTELFGSKVCGWRCINCGVEIIDLPGGGSGCEGCGSPQSCSTPSKN